MANPYYPGQQPPQFQPQQAQPQFQQPQQPQHQCALSQRHDQSFDDMLLFDAQTSGGLLIAVSRSEAEKLKERLVDEGYERSCIVGGVLPKKNSPLVVE